MGEEIFSRGGDTRKDTMKGITEEERVTFFEEGYSFYIKF